MILRYIHVDATRTQSNAFHTPSLMSFEIKHLLSKYNSTIGDN